MSHAVTVLYAAFWIKLPL